VARLHVIVCIFEGGGGGFGLFYSLPMPHATPRTRNEERETRKRTSSCPIKRAERHTLTSAGGTLCFRMSRAHMLANLPLYCSVECATPTNTSLLQIFRGTWPMLLPLLNHSALALFAQRTHIPTSARSIGLCVIWVCICS